MSQVRLLVRFTAIVVLASLVGLRVYSPWRQCLAEDRSLVVGESTPEPTSEKWVEPLKHSADRCRIAVAQIEIKPEAIEDGLSPVSVLTPWIERASNDKADLIVFPEYLLGHFKTADPSIGSLCSVAKNHSINVIVGGWEFLPDATIKHPPDPGTYCNTLLVIDRNGNIAGKHRKMHSAVGAGSPYCWPPDPGERGEHTMLKGDENGVVDLDFGRIGLLTCYDGYFFESFQMPSLRGAEVLIWANGRLGMVEPHIIQAASFMTCTHVVASNQAMGTGSAICSYPGWKLDAVAPREAGEAYIVADLDLASLREQRLNNRMFHQRRPGIYKPLVENWQPWTAYPDLKPFTHDSQSTSNESEEGQ